MLYFLTWLAWSVCVCVFIATTLLQICIRCRTTADAATRSVRKKSPYFSIGRYYNGKHRPNSRNFIFDFFPWRWMQCSAKNDASFRWANNNNKLANSKRKHESMEQLSFDRGGINIVFIQILLFFSKRNHKLMNRLIRNHSAFDAQRDYKYLNWFIRFDTPKFATKTETIFVLSEF